MTENRNWQVIPNLGAEYLETISEQTRLWRFWSMVGDQPANQLEELQAMASSAVDENAAALMAGSDTAGFEDILDSLDQGQSRAIIRSHLAELATSKLASLDESPRLGTSIRKAQLRVIKSGVQGEDHWSEVGIKDKRLANMPRLGVDSKVFEGFLSHLRIQPKLGGVAVLTRALRETQICGLVNPLTGQPQVDLQILKYAKTQES